ncbi:MAG TPA: SAM-dependent methyltransferase, partial [Roseiflexaceae bacterium]|nr:SAM-dependent methyltransferase [Roseiflexaceae bacterium]
PAPATHALPGETWREALARRARCAAARQLLRRGQVRTPADLITHNLDILRFALDAAAACESPADLRALWGALRGLTVLDPTCGAGAFLLAAARVLEPLYHACLGRMDTLAHGDADLQRALEEADRPPGRRANVLATILADNLYGVDILPEAVEVCRMRLALEYAARLQPPPAHQRDEAEPGPKGCSHAAAIASEAAERCSNPAPAHESGAGGEGLPAREAALVSRAMKLPHLHAGDALDAELWPTAFPRVMQEGGFDAVIGNPPYVALAGTRAMYAARGYTTAAGGNLYALVVERALALLRSGGRLGVIVPLAAVSTGGMAALQALYAPHEQWHSHFAVRPARLFDGVDMNLTISLLRKAQGACHTTGYRRWSDGALSERPHLFTTLAYTRNPRLPTHANPFPKLGSPLEARILERMLAHGRRLGDYVTPGGITLYYHSGGRYWRKALTTKLSSHYKPITVAPEHAPAVFGLLNSQLFYWYWIGNSNCMDVVSREVLGLPVFALERADRGAFAELMEELLAAYAGARRTRARRGARIRVDEANFEVARARPVIDAIDGLLARCYGLDEEELDFIRSYDLKHRARGGS